MDDPGITEDRAIELLKAGECVYASINSSNSLWAVKSITKKYVTFVNSKCEKAKIGHLTYYGSGGVKL